MCSKLKAVLVLFALLFGIMASNSHAFIPTGWVYMDYPYAYNPSVGEWHYLNEANPTWVNNMTTGAGWYRMRNSILGGGTQSGPGWAYWALPWAYCSANQSWYWVPTDAANTTWVRNMNTGQWSKLGELQSGSVQFTLTWDQAVDLDLHVSEPGGETINYMNRTSASGGRLDVDDTEGYGPENIYWPQGVAPRGRYQPAIFYYSSRGWSGPVNWTLRVKRQGYPDATVTGTFSDSSQVGLSQLTPSYMY